MAEVDRKDTPRPGWASFHGGHTTFGDGQVSVARAAFAPDHFNYAFLQNQDRQVHLHVIPRYAKLAISRASNSTILTIPTITPFLPRTGRSTLS